jgi:integrase
MEDYESWVFLQDPRLQVIKGSQCIKSFFVGQVDDLIANVINWKNHLEAKGRKGKDYLFPKITPSFNRNGEHVMEIGRDYIASQTIIRGVVKQAFESNGLKYIKPHNFRHSISRHVRKSGNNVTDTLIALAENMGQKNGYSTLVTSYAGDPLESRAKLMKAIVLE